MQAKTAPERLLLPRTWPEHVKTAFLHAISLAHIALTHARVWCVKSPIERVRLKALLERARCEIGCLKEEIRIKDARMARVPAHRRPHYLPTERMAILELRAARAWSKAQTARAFLVASSTIALWLI